MNSLLLLLCSHEFDRVMATIRLPYMSNLWNQVEVIIKMDILEKRTNSFALGDTSMDGELTTGE